MADTSAAFPVTDRAAAWPGLGWLRVAVLAGLVGGLGAAAFNGLFGESVLGEAIRLEEAGAEHVTAIAAPFTRGEQQGGMVLGELVLGGGLGLLLAGAALVAGPAFLGPARRAWLALVAAGAWAFLALPAIAYPALPPGSSRLSRSIRGSSPTWRSSVRACSERCSAGSRGCTSPAGCGPWPCSPGSRSPPCSR